MAVRFPRERLTDLLIDPREDLDLELKNWLDLIGNNESKATFAKAAIALANHGGGFIVLGLTEQDGGAVEAVGRPAAFVGYDQDHINGIVHSYAEPPFHCAVHHVANPAGNLFPVVVVPGGHRVPIRAKRSGPNGNIVQQNSIYVRKPGPRSEIPQSGQDWDMLLARCLVNRRDEMLDQIRDLISGVVPAAVASAEPARLERWIEQSLSRWRELANGLPTDDPARCPHGFHWFAYELAGDLRRFEGAAFAEAVRRSVVRHSGWPPFWYPTRVGITPYPYEGCVECWLGGDTEQDPGSHDAAHSDFWRISPDGFAFLLRGYQEDGLEDRPNRPAQPSAALFDITLPIWRTGEVLLHAESLATTLINGPATIALEVHYQGLSGRTLTSLSGSQLLMGGHISRQDTITMKTVVDAVSVGPNLPEIVQPLLEPLYALFDFFQLPPSLVVRQLSEMRGQPT